MSDWTPLPEGVTWRREPLFDLVIRRSELIDRFKDPQHVGLDSGGIGLFDAWTMRFSCGLEVALWCFEGAQGRPSDRPTFIPVRADSADRRHVAFHLGFVGAERYVHPEYEGRDEPDRWRVLRTDDNGNDYEVARVSSSCEASRIAEAYEARGHKQFYWIDEVSLGSASLLAETGATRCKLSRRW